MNVSANHQADGQILSPNGKPRLIVEQNIVTRVTPCSPSCILPRLQNKQVVLVPLGGTRKDTPGVRFDNELFVTNVFTWSRREKWSVHRSLATFELAISRIRAAGISQLVAIHNICTCSSSMEYLDGYQLLENTSIYTPKQHRSMCWSDHHSVEEFLGVYRQILATTKALNQQNVIHTDITGFNILVNESGDWKLIDLFSCVTVESLGPSWIPMNIKKWIGKKIEYSQMKKYLLEPARERWGQDERLSENPLDFKVKK